MDSSKEPFKLSELSALIDSCLEDASEGKDEKINSAQLDKDPSAPVVAKVFENCWSQCSKESGIADIFSKISEFEKKKDEIESVFTSCMTSLEEYKNAPDVEEEDEEEVSISSDSSEAEVEPEVTEDIDVAAVSSDDDVQFISTSFDPTKAKQQKEKQLQQQQQKQQQQALRAQQQQQQQQQQLQQQHQQHQPQQKQAGGIPQQFQPPPGVLTPAQLRNLMQQPSAMKMLSSGQLTLGSMQTPAGVVFPFMPHNMQQFGIRPPPGMAAPGLPMPHGHGPVMKRPALTQRPHTSMPVPPPKLVVGMKIFAKKHTERWQKGAIVELVNEDKPKHERRYKIKFDQKGVKTVPGKLLAMTDSPKEILPVGTRIIALYRAEEEEQRAYYAGIVAEPPSLRNQHRYLAFFDDGYAQYCHYSEVHRVFEQSSNVWEDIHLDSQDFIRGYLQQYPERPMVRLQKGQIVKTEWKGKWWIAKVTEVDASLVKMHFEADQRIEWIYRGSTRLEPLYTELANQEASKLSGKGRRHNLMTRDRRPVVEYFSGMGDTNATSTPPKPDPPVTSGKRAPVAKKSTAMKKHKEMLLQKKNYSSPDVDSLDESSNGGGMGGSGDVARCHTTGFTNNSSSTVSSQQGQRQGVVSSMLVQRSLQQRHTYRTHACNAACLAVGNGSNDPAKFRGSNPLYIPQLCGWERQLCRIRGAGNMAYRKSVSYRAPCGRRLRNMHDLDRFLQLTGSVLTFDLFCFDPILRTDTEYVATKTFCDIKDLSYGKETVPISCVNGIDRQYPDYVEYSNQRIPAKGVSLNLDPDFLVGCDCTDGCRDKNKCACIQRTMEASRASHSGRANAHAPYKHRRLRDHVVTGIYECNSKCKCSSTCCNRVAQNGLNLRLQVFKTEKRGWGLRCMDDIPAGGFICIYAGQLLTEQGANEDGQQYGDEYLAELDYIEVVERNKEGYESDVEMSNDDTDEESKPADDSDRAKEKEKKKVEQVEKVAGGAIIISDDEASSQSSISENSNMSSRKQAEDHDPGKAEAGIAGLMITEPTSLNVDNEDEDSDDGGRDKDHRVRRSTRVTTQPGFSNLPDPKRQHDDKQEEENKKFKSTRHYFGEEECYVMDAKSMGNLGRYLNHSCSPNVFVQNVFVDTHDLRFPWVAFFAKVFIRAGTELTWDYNYDVGSVPGKVLYCYCGTRDCRGRLL